ncbi:8664_t:CDS:1, partial [Gigaspora margarita]
ISNTMDDKIDTPQSTLSAQPFDESFADPITRSNSPVSEISSSAKSDTETYNKPTSKKAKLVLKGGSKKWSWVWKYYEEKKVIETVQQLNQKVNVEITYGICCMLINLDKKCNAKLKVSGGSTSNLISHLSSVHGITQDGLRLSGQDD